MRVLFLPYSKTNPYVSMLRGALERTGVSVVVASSGTKFLREALLNRVNAVHLQWLHQYSGGSGWKVRWRPRVVAIQLLILRCMGVKVIWTVHNLQAHEVEGRDVELWLGRFVGRIANSVIAHCEVAKTLVCRRYKIKPKRCAVVPHGNYIPWYKNEINQSDARVQLSLPKGATVGLFFGAIRFYKGVDNLLSSFSSIEDDRLRLMIAGRVMHLDASAIDQKVTGDQRVVYVNRFIDDQDVQVYMNAADFVVFPYRDILTSGAVMLAMSFGKACVAPRIGCIREVLDDQGAFLYDPLDPEGLKAALQRAYATERETLSEMGSHNHQIAEAFDWDILVDKIGQLYR